MANNTTVFNAIPNNVLLCSVVFKFIAMLIGVLGNVTVITHKIFSNKEKTAKSYLAGNLIGVGIFSRVFNILSNMGH